jgi:glycerol-3-phosphate acyltransferase PlsY
LSTGTILTAVGLVVLGYLVGSLSPSVFLGRRLRGLDVRRHGSGNAGTTNAFRVLGWRLGLAVLLLDILKGVLPVLLARSLSSPMVTVLMAFACVLGHNYSLFLRGKGGKGVATGAGAVFGMMPLVGAVLIVVYLVILFSTRIVSVASIICTALLPVLAFVFHEPLPYLVVSCILAVVVLWAHRTNMVRLWAHTEPRIALSKSLRRREDTAPETHADGRRGL